MGKKICFNKLNASELTKKNLSQILRAAIPVPVERFPGNKLCIPL